MFKSHNLNICFGVLLQFLPGDKLETNVALNNIIGNCDCLDTKMNNHIQLCALKEVVTIVGPTLLWKIVVEVVEG